MPGIKLLQRARVYDAVTSLKTTNPEQYETITPDER